jgi:hypothetical protein
MIEETKLRVYLDRHPSDGRPVNVKFCANWQLWQDCALALERAFQAKAGHFQVRTAPFAQVELALLNHRCLA